LVEAVTAGTTSEEYKTQKGFAWVRGLGEGLVACSQTVLTIGHLGRKNKHWVALAVDTEVKKIHYGDSVGSLIPTNLLAAYQWWMQQHCSSSFELDNLPITQQEDESSCGILADNTLTHLTFPDEVPLYAPLEMQAARMSTFIQVMNTILEFVRGHLSISLPYLLYSLLSPPALSTPTPLCAYVHIITEGR
jgi:hypothetical protein